MTAFLKREGATYDVVTGRELTPEEVAALPPTLYERDHITFSSGRSIYANCGIVGIDAKLEISEGYDGGIDWPNTWNDDPETALTADDMRELADLMLDRWTRFKEGLT